MSKAFLKGKLALGAITFPDTSCWTKTQRENFNIEIPVTVVDKQNNKTYSFIATAISLSHLNQYTEFYVKNAIILQEYSEAAIQEAVENNIAAANNEGANAFDYLTHHLQYANEESLYKE